MAATFAAEHRKTELGPYTITTFITVAELSGQFNRTTFRLEVWSGTGICLRKQYSYDEKAADLLHDDAVTNLFGLMGRPDWTDPRWTPESVGYRS